MFCCLGLVLCLLLIFQLMQHTANMQLVSTSTKCLATTTTRQHCQQAAPC